MKRKKGKCAGGTNMSVHNLGKSHGVVERACESGDKVLINSLIL